MGLFSSKSQKELPWIALTSVQELDALSSYSKPFLLFKHSTRCGISRMALSSFERNWNVENDSIDLFFIDLLAHRDVSNKVAENYSIQHQSPQVLVINDDKVVYSESHSGIDAKQIQQLFE